MLLRKLFLASLIITATGCSTLPPPQSADAVSSAETRARLEHIWRSAAAEAQAQPKVEDEDDGQTSVLDAMLRRGLALIGTPYHWGGTTERTGFDCSGFINYLFYKEAGVRLPRTTRDLVRMPAPRVDKGELQRGDLLFFATRGRQVSHAGIYLGDDTFLHSSSSNSGGVRIDRLSEGYWDNHYLSAMRIPLQ